MINNFADELLCCLYQEQMTIGEMLVRYRLTKDILYLGVVQWKTWTLLLLSYEQVFILWFEPAIFLASTPANALIQTFTYCLTSVINIKSKNWSLPANNTSCLGHDLFIIYTVKTMIWKGLVICFGGFHSVLHWGIQGLHKHFILWNEWVTFLHVTVHVSRCMD